MIRTKRDAGWVVAFAVLLGLAVPWFLWGNDTTVAGLPIWLWWHIGWMGLAAVVFHMFTQQAWDRMMGVADGAPPVRKPAATKSDEA